MASSNNARYDAAAAQYAGALQQETGIKGYNESLKTQKDADLRSESATQQGMQQGQWVADRSNSFAKQNAGEQANASTNSAIEQGNRFNANSNAEAQKYAGQQASAAAAGAQSQATTAARAAGMNKAQAAMMGSQQNANAYQNAYGNAYSQQLGNASGNQNTQLNNYNAAYENNANRMNSNINNQQNAIANERQYQQNLRYGAGRDLTSGYGNIMGGQQQEGQNEYNRKWGNWGAGIGMLTSDEKLKHYRECSKKVVYRAPSKIKALKFVKDGE